MDRKIVRPDCRLLVAGGQDLHSIYRYIRKHEQSHPDVTEKLRVSERVATIKGDGALG